MEGKYGGVIVDPETFPQSCTHFASELKSILSGLKTKKLLDKDSYRALQIKLILAQNRSLMNFIGDKKNILHIKLPLPITHLFQHRRITSLDRINHQPLHVQ